MTLDEVRALKEGDVVHDGQCWPWVVSKALCEAGEERRPYGVTHTMRLRTTYEKRTSTWLISNQELDQIHRPEEVSVR